MKVFVSYKALDKIKKAIDNAKPTSVSIRKYRKDDDTSQGIMVQGLFKLSDKQRERHKSGVAYSVYISKKRLDEINKSIHTGGIIPLLPLIFGGLSALGSLAGGTAGIVKAVSDSKYNNEKLEEEQRHNKEMESIAVKGDGLYLSPPKTYEGGCTKNILREFTDKLKTDEIGRKAVKNTLKNMTDYVKIAKLEKGNGIFLQPY